MSGPKEHAGGTPHVHVEWHDDHAFAVPSEEFNHAALDRPSDLVLEAIRLGKDPGAVVTELMEAEADAIRAETVNRLLGFVISSDRPRLAAYALAFTCSVAIVENLTPAEVARRCGCSKQNVQQAIKRAHESLGLRKTSWMRDEEARERMSKRNARRYGPTKKETS